MKHNAKDLPYRNISSQENALERENDELSTKKKFGFIPQWYFSELWEIFNIAWTMVSASLCFMLMGPMSLIFSGRFGTSYLAGLGLANTIINITCILIGQGLASACDTCFSQAYGSTNKLKAGLYLQRSVVVILMLVLPCWALLLNTEHILLLLGQEPEIARISGRYTLAYMPAVPGHFLNTILSKYLRSQNIVKPIMVIGAVGLAVNALFQFILVSHFGFGVEGSAVSQILGFWSMAGSTLAYICISKAYVKTWPGWTWELFQEWGTFLKLAIAGLLMLSLQFWAFEAGTLLAGTLSEVQLAAQAIILQVETITFMIPAGISVGVNIRIGQLLGANNRKQAKRAVVAGYTLAWMASLFIIILLLTLRYHIPRIFSQESDVIDLAGNLVPIVAFYHILDCTSCVSSRILCGCGRQVVAACVVFAGMYLIGLPAGICMMLLTNLKTAGFWWGMTIALFCETILYVTIVYNTDWEKQTQMAQIRSGVFPSKPDPKSINRDDQCSETCLKESDMASDEKRAIICNGSLKKSESAKTKLYSSETTSSQQDVSEYEMPKALTSSQLLFRRTLYAFCLLSILGLGLFTRLYFEHKRENTISCSPYGNVNGTFIVGDVNLTIPICNNTTPS
ncbi:multidrug and toxin extrusion protein 1-like [Lineus longissimus]|uniref:multidrug and toxin extrusion protein 1-like n=1 Tax=Lineus longissimus TaxID=88925 RepID=UPI00315D3F86